MHYLAEKDSVKHFGWNILSKISCGFGDLTKLLCGKIGLISSFWNQKDTRIFVLAVFLKNIFCGLLVFAVAYLKQQITLLTSLKEGAKACGNKPLSPIL